MDLDADGDIDIVSGSYSRTRGGGLAGLFQVFLSDGEGGFAQSTPVLGTDGTPLIVDPHPDTYDESIERICTRPFAADLDGDGLLDILTGNFGGTFSWFRGTGKGEFSPDCTYLTDGDGELIRVKMHSDPFLVDWDRDGDLDLVSGSDMGGVKLFVNAGSATSPRFDAAVTLVGLPKSGTVPGGGIELGEPDLRGPKSAMRVFVADVNGDGKHDLLVGDHVTYMVPARGLDKAEALKRHAAWQERYDEIIARQIAAQRRAAADPAAKGEVEEARAALGAHHESKGEIVRSVGTGFVWLYLGE